MKHLIFVKGKFMKTNHLLIALNLVLVAGLAGQITYRYQDKAISGQYMASWKDRPASLNATVALSENIVHARVVKIAKAKPLRIAMDGEPGRVDTIPIEVITLQLTDASVKGKGKKGEKIQVFHTGHSDAIPPSKRRDKPKGAPPPRPDDAVEEADADKTSRDEHLGVLFSGVMNDPAYKVGEEYVLFLRGGPEVSVGSQKMKTQAIISPEGRYKVGRNKTITAMSPRDFARGMNGKNAKNLKDKAKNANKGRSNSPR